jgi:SAM-dependent methyltransferase
MDLFPAAAAIARDQRVAASGDDGPPLDRRRREPTLDLATSYNQYYQSGLYGRRYPRPNPNMTRLLRKLLPPDGTVLDFGCGTGRYAVPLLAAGARVIAYDISEVALRDLIFHQDDAVLSGRLRAVGGTFDDLMGAVPPRSLDLVTLMFGVLGHIRGGAARMETLRRLSGLLRPGGRMVITVPNAVRRFAAEQAACAPLIACGELEAGDILYRRHAPSGPVGMYYHLFTAGGFSRLLDASGLDIESLRAESIMPERAVVGLPFGALIDRALMAVWPRHRAYGFAAVATPRGP